MSMPRVLAEPGQDGTAELSGIPLVDRWVAGLPLLPLNSANLTEERAATGAIGSNDLATPDYVPLRPRTIALRLGVSF